MDRNKELAHLALSTVGIEEEGGDNEGFFVELFQKNVNGQASGEAWCMSYVLYMIEHVDKLSSEHLMMSVEGHSLHRTKHCQTMWHKSPKECKMLEPEVGCVVIWKYGNTTSGHCGIVTEINGDYIVTVEGNTSDSSSIDRDGDGVYTKRRLKWKNSGKMRTLGYLNPWVKG